MTSELHKCYEERKLLLEFLDLYVKTYMRTQTHPTPAQEAAVMELALALEKKGLYF